MNVSMSHQRWLAAEDSYLRDHYLTKTHAQMADVLGRTLKAVRSRCSQLGYVKNQWLSPEEIERVRRWYESREGKDLNLAELAEQMGRSRVALTRTAKRLNLTNPNRSRPSATENLKKASEALRLDPSKRLGAWSCEDEAFLRSWYADRPNGAVDCEHLSKILGRSRSSVVHKVSRLGLGNKNRVIWGEGGFAHPKGFAGKKISEHTRARLDAGMTSFWAAMTPEERTMFSGRAVQTKIERYGTANPMIHQSNPYSRTKSGKRDDLDNLFVRSSWEANYARYLNWLKARGEIKSWKYEARTFVFEGIKQGTRTYTPDFEVVNLDASLEYHEVKGWMDAKSKTRLKRMAKYFPDIKIVLIDAKVYRLLNRQLSRLIPNWEVVAGGGKVD